MLASGNSEPQTCVNNLLKTWRKEGFYGRRKGIPTSLQDQPFSSASDQLAIEAEDMIEEFEDRVEVNSIEVVENEEDALGIELIADIDIVNESLDEDEEEEDE